MLEIDDINVSYGHVNALNGVSFQVPWGAIVGIIGSNGAGKSTLINTISGLVKKQSGSILLDGEVLQSSPHLVVKRGIVQVPEGRKIFSGLTTLENLIIGGYLIEAKHANERIKEMYRLFPILEERKDQLAGTLSGGEQQMLAIARGLMADPKIMLLDEPSLGLAPLVIKVVFEHIQRINKMGITVLLVEQNAKKALSISDYIYVLENGRIILSGPPKEISSNPSVIKAYLGETK
jgi:branched-chain amino acid transport system ATP-binding protein